MHSFTSVRTILSVILQGIEALILLLQFWCFAFYVAVVAGFARSFLFVFQMVLQPKVQADGRPLRPSAKKGDIREAVTRYRVLADNGSAALVQCTPETGLYCGFVRCNSFCA